MPSLVVGREAEEARLVTATTRPGAVCVVEGAGGVGKSTLALHVAHQVADAYPGGCLYADLGGASGPVAAMDVMATFLRSLGAPIAPADADEASALFRTWCADRGVLVVLDNAASAAQLRPLLPSGPSCASIVTSRWALPELDATVRLRLAPLLATAATAARLLYPQDTLPITAPSRQPALTLTSTTEARAWFERERVNLLPLARQQVAAGRSLGQVRDLALLTVKFTDYSGYVTEQLQFGELAVDAAQRLGDRAGTAAARNIVAVTKLRQGRLDDGIDLLRRTIVTLRELGDGSREAACLNNLGNALRDKGDLVGAMASLRAALALRRELGQRYKEGSVLDNLALVYQRCGQYSQAIAHHETGLAITREGVDPLREAQSLVNYAETLSKAGDQEAAIALAEESLAISRRHEHKRGAGLALRLLGDAHARLGRPATARRCWQEALPLLEGLDHEAHAALSAALAR